jgi:hypothetical protein
MKKYFGNKQEWTLEELKNLVAKHPQLGFYRESIICNITGQIGIHNWNGDFKGNSCTKFKQIENKNWVRR